MRIFLACGRQINEIGEVLKKLNMMNYEFILLIYFFKEKNLFYLLVAIPVSQLVLNYE